MQIAAELRRVLVASAPYFVHNRIVSHGQGSINSSGEQITGGS
jgi:hypothetical protein